MGNQPSSPPSPDEVKSQFENAFDPQKNGIAEQFDPNNSNGFMGKTKDVLDDAFQKGGVGNTFLRKAGDTMKTVAGVYDDIGNAVTTVGGGLTAVGLPEFGVPIGLAGGVFKTASPILHTIGDKTNRTADVIEAPKSDLGKNIPDLIFH